MPRLYGGNGFSTPLEMHPEAKTICADLEFWVTISLFVGQQIQLEAG